MAQGNPDDGFFGSEPLEASDARFLTDPDNEVDTGMLDDEPAPPRRKLAAWKIVVGIMAVVFLGVGALNIYRGMNRSAAADFPTGDAGPSGAGLVAGYPKGSLAAADAPATAPATAATTAQATPVELAGLLRRVGDLESQVAQLRGAGQRPAPRATYPTKSRPKAVDPKKAPPTAEAGKAVVNSLSGKLRLRNITEGQAWIEDADGHTTVVGVGDSVAGAKITRIVPDAYRVDTDRGSVTFAATNQ